MSKKKIIVWYINYGDECTDLNVIEFNYKLKGKFERDFFI